MVREKETQGLDVAQIFKTLRKKFWLIGLAALIATMAGFVFGQFFLQPRYDANVTFYVNNSAETNDSVLTSSDITASQQLMKTYGAIIKSRSVLEQVISQTQCSYTCEQLQKMIQVEAVDGSQIMRVTVTTGDPQQSVQVANSIAQVLPLRITEIMKTTSVQVVDEAVADLENRAPNVILLSAIGFMVGGGIAVFVLAIIAVLDDRIYSETYLEKLSDSSLLVKISSSSVDSEPYRRLDAQLDLAVPVVCPVIGVTGARTDDGGSITAYNLACARAERGKKVLLVSAHENEAEYTEERSQCHEYLQITSVDLLAEDNIDFLEKQKATFDCILLDIPAVNEFADTFLLAGRMDGLLLSVRLGYSRKKEMDDCLRQLHPSALKVIGFAVHSEQ